MFYGYCRYKGYYNRWLSIYKKLTRYGIDVLLIRPGYIELPGYPYGFIGGTNGNLSKDIIVFSGSLKEHPDYEKKL